VTPETLFLLFLAAVTAGFVDAIAGGGGLVTLPALLWAGLPPVAALSTNKLQGFSGSLASTLTFGRAGHLELRAFAPAVLTSALAGLAGALTIRAIDPGATRAIVPVLLVAASLYFLFSPRVADAETAPRIPFAWFALVPVPAIAFYDGFFGPGAGSFYALALVGLLGLGLRRATAHAKLLNVASNGAAFAGFLLGGEIVWTAGLVMVAGQVLGSWLGSRAAITWGARLIRPLLVVMALATTVKILTAADQPLGIWLRNLGAGP
jgi:hypothetical protein